MLGLPTFSFQILKEFPSKSITFCVIGKFYPMNDFYMQVYYLMSK